MNGAPRRATTSGGRAIDHAPPAAQATRPAVPARGGASAASAKERLRLHPTVNDVKEVFDDWARRGRAEGMEAGHGQTAASLLSTLEAKGKRFLDLGCGNGWAARWAARNGARAVGVDASPEMVQLAIEAARQEGVDTTVGGEGPGAEFHAGDFAQLECPDGHFDVVWSMEALYYAPDPDAVLREVRRALAPGGVLHVLIDHYEENEASHSWSNDVGIDMTLRSEQAWHDAFHEAGFSDVVTQRLVASDPDADDWKKDQGTLHISATS